MTFGTDTNRTATMTNSTVRQKCVLEAWATADTTVSTFPIDVPGDGRFFVAALKCMDNGNGTWHYEVCPREPDIGSAPAAGSRSRLPAGAVISNAESPQSVLSLRRALRQPADAAHE